MHSEGPSRLHRQRGTPLDLVERQPGGRPDRALLSWEEREQRHHNRITRCTNIILAIFAGGSVATSMATIFNAVLSQSTAIGWYQAQMSAANLALTNRQTELATAQAVRAKAVTADGSRQRNEDGSAGLPLDAYALHNYLPQNDLPRSFQKTTNAVVQTVSNVNSVVFDQQRPFLYAGGMVSQAQAPYARKLLAGSKAPPKARPISPGDAREAERAVGTALRKYRCRSGESCSTCNVSSKEGKQNPCACLQQAKKMIEMYLATGQSGRPTPEPVGRKFGRFT